MKRWRILRSGTRDCVSVVERENPWGAPAGEEVRLGLEAGSLFYEIEGAPEPSVDRCRKCPSCDQCSGVEDSRLGGTCAGWAHGSCPTNAPARDPSEGENT